MLPIYILGNFHCLGMCGPLAMMIGTSPHRGYYLLGRLISFTLAGALAGGLGYLIAAFLQPYKLSSLLSILLGFAMGWIGIAILRGKPLSFKGMDKIEAKLSRLLIEKGPFSLFLFGFLSIALPCGQTLLVYSACALSGSAATGTLNGLAFAILTTPALFLAMQARHLLRAFDRFYKPVVGGVSLLIGGVSIYRGLIDAGVWA